MLKLFVTDLDGTLIENNIMPEGNHNAINKLKATNHYLAIATGRAYNQIEFLHEKYNIRAEYYVLLNGGLIIDGNNRVIKHEVIPYDISDTIVKKYSDNLVVNIENGYTTFCFSREEEMSGNFPRSYVSGIEKLCEEKISLISFKFKEGEIERAENICQEINREFGSLVTAYRNTQYIDIVPGRCSKGEGVEFIAKTLGISRESIYTIGDSWNDVSMFEIAGNSFTFHKAETKLHKHARFIVNSVEECINDYVLGDRSA